MDSVSRNDQCEASKGGHASRPDQDEVPLDPEGDALFDLAAVDDPDESFDPDPDDPDPDDPDDPDESFDPDPDPDDPDEYLDPDPDESFDPDPESAVDPVLPPSVLAGIVAVESLPDLEPLPDRLSVL